LRIDAVEGDRNAEALGVASQGRQGDLRCVSDSKGLPWRDKTGEGWISLSSSRGALKAGNSFRISSRNRRVYTTLAVETEAVGKAAAQQVEKRFLLSCGLSHPAQSDLTAVCRGQNDVAAVQFG